MSEQIPKAIKDRLDVIGRAQGLHRAPHHKIMCEVWYRTPVMALGKSPKQCVEEGNEQVVLTWMAAWEHGAFP